MRAHYVLRADQFSKVLNSLYYYFFFIYPYNYHHYIVINLPRHTTDQNRCCVTSRRKGLCKRCKLHTSNKHSGMLKFRAMLIGLN